MGASVVAGVDASPVFEAAEHDLDLVALAVQRPVMRDSDLDLEGMQASMPRSARAFRNPLPS